MRIKFLQSISGDMFSYSAGDIADFPDDEANRMIAANIAQPAIGDKYRPDIEAIEVRSGMKRVLMLDDLVGDGFFYEAQQITDLKSEVANAYVGAGIAKFYYDDDKVEETSVKVEVPVVVKSGNVFDDLPPNWQSLPQAKLLSTARLLDSNVSSVNHAITVITRELNRRAGKKG
jgi:hypothetical protein